MKKIIAIVIVCSFTGFAFSQNFGINEPNPIERLHVTGNSLVTGNTYIGSTDAFFFRDAANRIATTSQFYVQAASANTFLYSSNTYLGNSGDLIHLRTNTFDWTSGGGGIINPAGDVGIGTITPAHKLDVVGDINFTGLLHLNGSSGTANNVLISNGALAPTWTTVGSLMLNLTAGTGITSSSYDGSTARTFNVVARNGITANADDIELGGTLDETTTITQGAFDMNYDLTSTGNFIVKKAGINAMWVQDDGNTYVGATNTAANDILVADRLSDWDDAAYYVDPNGANVLNEVRADNGTASDASFTFNADQGSGMFLAGTNLLAFATASTERMRVDASGNIGIGTIAPGALLDIQQATYVANSILFRLGTSSDVQEFIVDSEGDVTTDGDFIAAGSDVYDNSGPIRLSGEDAVNITMDYNNTADGTTAIMFGKASQSAPTELMRIQENGNVGIGTNAPGEKLEVVGNVISGFATPNAVMGTHPSYANPQYAAWWKDGSDYSMLTDGSNTFLSCPLTTGNIYLRANNTNRVFIRGSDGNVGIGNTAPGYPLEVTGTDATGTMVASAVHSTATATAWTASQTITRNVSIKANGFIWATLGFISASDLRAKENIESTNSESSLDLINNLNVVKYNWIDKTKSNHQFEDGFIAQEVEKVMPDAVDKNKEFIPNVYALADHYRIDGELMEITLAKEADIKKGDLIKLYTEDGKEYRLNVSEVKGNVYYMPVDEESKKIMGHLFVYGKEVDDFGTVNYDRVFTVGISAIQELSKQIDALKVENASLKSENGNIKSTNEELNNRMNGLKAEIDLINERLNMKAVK